MKNRVLVAVILLLPVGLFLYFWWIPGAVKMPADREVKTAQETPAAKALATTSPPANVVIASNLAAVSASQSPAIPNPAKMPPVSAAPAPLEFTSFPPDIVLEKVAHAIHDYASMFGGNPVGTNPEITAALNGKNPRQANFITPEAGMRINGNGELVDAWGTPYFFHQLSGTDMEIHSAGPDRVLWTFDDLIAK